MVIGLHGVKTGNAWNGMMISTGSDPSTDASSVSGRRSLIGAQASTTLCFSPPARPICFPALKLAPMGAETLDLPARPSRTSADVGLQPAQPDVHLTAQVVHHPPIFGRATDTKPPNRLQGAPGDVGNVQPKCIAPSLNCDHRLIVRIRVSHVKSDTRLPTDLSLRPALGHLARGCSARERSVADGVLDQRH